MKLRTRSQSIRLRLARGEVTALLSMGHVTEAVVFGPGAELRATLRVSSTRSELGAVFDGGHVIVEVPESVARAWAGSDEVSLTGRQDVAGGEAVSLLVEKDFACLKPRTGEDDSDAFPHPNEATGVCG